MMSEMLDRRVREDLAELVARLRDVQQRFGSLEQRFYRDRTPRLSALEHRFSAMEARFGGMEDRMTSMLAVIVRIAERLDGSTPLEP